MGVSVRLAGAVLLFVLALLPRTAGAAPIVVDRTIDDPLNTTALGGTFTVDNDIFLFHFTLDEGTFTFTAAATSAATGFDPILSLFGPDGTLVTYTDADGGLLQAVASEPEPDGNAGFPVLSLAGGSTYTLAVTQWGFTSNFPLAQGTITGTLADGFEADGFPCFADLSPEAVCDPDQLFGGLGQSGEFTLTFAVDPVGGGGGEVPVPEPNTLSLMALGLAAAFSRRRRARHNTNTQ
jgi:hypothetical protein